MKCLPPGPAARRSSRRIPFLLAALLALILAACGESVSGPEPLDDQKALSLIAKDRHYTIDVYLEGETTVDGRRVLVFAERTLSKFGGAGVRLFTLPVEALALQTDVGTYQGPDRLRYAYHLFYRHDEGEFALSDTKGSGHSPDRVLETVGADFEEAYTLAEERCLNATAKAAEDPSSVRDVDYAAAICLWSGDIGRARPAASRLLELENGRGGYARHKGHTHLGRIALLDGDTAAAIEHLGRSVDVRPSATMSSFGPNMALARDLLAVGETDAVLAYFEACGRFWKDGQLATWTAQVQRGETPNFGGNLNY